MNNESLESGRDPHVESFANDPAPKHRGFRGFIRRHKLITALVAIIALITILRITISVATGPGSFTAHGIAEDCTGTLTDGSQVTVIDSARNVIGTATLAEDNSKAATALIKQYDTLQGSLGTLGGPGPGMGIYDFTVTAVPAGQPRYGVSIGNSHGTIWFSAGDMVHGPELTLGC